MRMREFRQARGLSRAQLAEIVKRADTRIDSTMIARFESEVCMPTPRVAKAIADALGAQMEEVFGVPEQLYIPATLIAEAPVEPMSFNEEHLIEILSHARCPLTRRELSLKLDISDRSVRELINHARARGYIIVNDGDGRGYRMAASTEDIERHFNTERKRAMSILSGLSASRTILRQEGRI